MPSRSLKTDKISLDIQEEGPSHYRQKEVMALIGFRGGRRQGELNIDVVAAKEGQKLRRVQPVTID